MGSFSALRDVLERERPALMLQGLDTYVNKAFLFFLLINLQTFLKPLFCNYGVLCVDQ